MAPKVCDAGVLPVPAATSLKQLEYKAKFFQSKQADTSRLTDAGRAAFSWGSYLGRGGELRAITIIVAEGQYKARRSFSSGIIIITINTTITILSTPPPSPPENATREAKLNASVHDWKAQRLRWAPRRPSSPSDQMPRPSVLRRTHSHAHSYLHSLRRKPKPLA
ncbi:hypothetical protein E2C01_019067 [Portunus trituberculatus]|uniref:Uncharacterized protein n=1 Tax=Portunus trituberculatus TaxID=210409 RepID=A0A5B7DY93_PORTR|nr:hypothetical protein [Portunus trituberculatus]